MASLVVLGARHLGGAILDRFLADGWSAAAVARSDDTLAAIAERGAIALKADIQSPESLAEALDRARGELGGLDLVVNAASVSQPRPGEPFGGGPVADASLEQYRRWGAAVGEVAFVFLSEGARALRATGTGGALIQITNSTARRVRPGQGSWSAGHHALRALVLAAAAELREEGIRAYLLSVDAPIESAKTAQRLADEGIPAEATADQAAIAGAVAYLAGQPERAMSHELAVTASGAPPLL
ncbi:MAG: hypothetical protein V7607_202 [Solirubrobacteraceae bacterium]